MIWAAKSYWTSVGEGVVEALDGDEMGFVFSVVGEEFADGEGIEWGGEDGDVVGGSAFSVLMGEFEGVREGAADGAEDGD